MGVKFSSVTIDGQTYTINQFTAGRSLKLLTRLGKMLGGPIAALAMKEGAKGMSVDKVFSDAVNSLFENLDEDKIEETVKMILEGTLVNGQSVNLDFDTRFQGDQLPHLFKVLKESLKIQYGGFSNVLSLAVAKAQAMGTAPSVQSISSGQSGG